MNCTLRVIHNMASYIWEGLRSATNVRILSLRNWIIRHIMERNWSGGCGGGGVGGVDGDGDDADAERSGCCDGVVVLMLVILMVLVVVLTMFVGNSISNTNATATTGNFLASVISQQTSGTMLKH